MFIRAGALALVLQKPKASGLVVSGKVGVLGLFRETPTCVHSHKSVEPSSDAALVVV